VQKLLLIGQAPSRHGDPERPLEGRIGKLLAELAGVSFEEYMEQTERMNLLNRWPGKAGKGDRWDAQAARERASELKQVFSGRVAVLLGRNVAGAFGLNALPWLTWTEKFGGRLSIIPHLSGIVTWWNSDENRRKAGDFFTMLLNTDGGRKWTWMI
jgi:hypothetical protein